MAILRAQAKSERRVKDCSARHESKEGVGLVRGPEWAAGPGVHKYSMGIYECRAQSVCDGDIHNGGIGCEQSEARRWALGVQ